MNKDYPNGLYELTCGENDFIAEKVAVINGNVHQDSDPAVAPVDAILSNLDDPVLTFLC